MDKIAIKPRTKVEPKTERPRLHKIILVNDGSRDRSWETISELSSRFAAVRGLNLMRNYGQHNALLCGIRAARYDVIVTMDDVKIDSDGTKFHWTLTGTNVGPGGTGKRVRISGYELWQIGDDGLIAESKGHFDTADYERQLKGE